MSDLITVSSTSIVPLSRTETLSRALQVVVPYRTTRIHIGRRTIFEFWKIGAKASMGMGGALSDPAVPRQTAYLVAFDDRDTFQMGYARDGEEPQTICDIPLARLLEAVQDLKLAGF